MCQSQPFSLSNSLRSKVVPSGFSSVVKILSYEGASSLHDDTHTVNASRLMIFNMIFFIIVLLF